MKSDSPKGVFHADPPIQHRYAQARREQVFGSGSAELWRALVYRVTCPECGSEPNIACASRSKTNYGEPLRGYHGQRMTAARREFGRKEKA